MAATIRFADLELFLLPAVRRERVVSLKELHAQAVLGEIFGQHWRRNKPSVERRFYLAGSFICQRRFFWTHRYLSEYRARSRVLKEKPVGSRKMCMAREIGI